MYNYFWIIKFSIMKMLSLSAAICILTCSIVAQGHLPRSDGMTSFRFSPSHILTTDKQDNKYYHRINLTITVEGPL